MTDPELKATVTQLGNEVLKLAQIMQKHAESQIRQEERDKRQDEINNRILHRLDHTDDSIQKLNEELIDIKLKRAEESDSRNFVKKNWPILCVLAMAGLYQIPKIFTLVPTK